MRIRKGNPFGLYAVYHSEEAAMRWNWFFGVLLRRRLCCFNRYMNAWELLYWEPKP